ncbi:hypothetical protein Hanom_Chr00s000005g01612521 [Helianthus anomalus]
MRTQEQSQLDKHRKQVQRLANQMVMHQGMEADMYLRSREWFQRRAQNQSRSCLFKISTSSHKL